MMNYAYVSIAWKMAKVGVEMKARAACFLRADVRRLRLLVCTFILRQQYFHARRIVRTYYMG